MSETDTTTFTKNGKDSTFFGVSVRAWLAIILVTSVAATHLAVTIGVVVDAVLTKDWSKVGTFANIGEPLYGLTIMALGFYFGQKATKTP